MAREVAPASVAPYSLAVDLGACRRIADAQYTGLDLTSEIEATKKLGFGDTVVIEEAGAAVGFAVCHVGAGAEAGSGACFVKFGAVTPGTGASRRFERLLDACASSATSRDAKVLIAGMNTARTRPIESSLPAGSGPRFKAWRCIARTPRRTASQTCS